MRLISLSKVNSLFCLFQSRGSRGFRGFGFNHLLY